MGTPTDKNKLERILFLIQQAGTLMLLPRTHLKHLGTSFDTVASHAYQTTVIAYCLSRMEGLSHEEALQSVGMTVFYSLYKARVDDLDLVAKHYAKVDEERAVDDELRGIPFADDIKNSLNDYKKRETLAGICARDAHSLAQFYVEWVLMWQGNQLAKKWFDSDFKDRIPGLKTESAKKLAFALKESNPNEWWWSQFLDKDAVKDIEKLIGK